MPRNRKYFVNKSVLLITSRTEEGLPMVPSLIMNFLIIGILAKAQKKYPVKICHFVFMANHFHMLLVVQNPHDVYSFIGYIKGEISHAINRLLGRRKRTIWCKGYDSPILLTKEDVIKYIEYIYLNPSKAKLVNSIDNYPGISSWDLYSQYPSPMTGKKIRRSLIRVLEKPSLSIEEQEEELNYYVDIQGEENNLEVSPDEWIKSFPNISQDQIKKINEGIKSTIKKKESLQIKSKSSSSSKRHVDNIQLRTASMLAPHRPESFSKKMVCICSNVELRKRFLGYYKRICEKARIVFEKWKHGMFDVRLPTGLLASNIPPQSSAIRLM